MKTYRHILAIDPSGCFEEGNGTTGWCLIDANRKQVETGGSISADGFGRMEEFWDKQIQLIRAAHSSFEGQLIVVIEDYLLYADKAASQVNSKMETCKLIGIMQHWCWEHHQPYEMQTASMVKTRWSNEILIHKGYIRKSGKGFYIPADMGNPISRHCIDAIRHGVHYMTFKNEKERQK